MIRSALIALFLVVGCSSAADDPEVRKDSVEQSELAPPPQDFVARKVQVPPDRTRQVQHINEGAVHGAPDKAHIVDGVQ
jgi:hypothetical protein